MITSKGEIEWFLMELFDYNNHQHEEDKPIVVVSVQFDNAKDMFLLPHPMTYAQALSFAYDTRMQIDLAPNPTFNAYFYDLKEEYLSIVHGTENPHQLTSMKEMKSLFKIFCDETDSGIGIYDYDYYDEDTGTLHLVPFLTLLPEKKRGVRFVQLVRNHALDKWFLVLRKTDAGLSTFRVVKYE